MTTQTLLDFDLEESSSDSDFRIEDHDESDDDFSDNSNAADSGKDDEDDDDSDDSSGSEDGSGSEFTNFKASLLGKTSPSEKSGDIKNVLDIVKSTPIKNNLPTNPICCACLGDRSDHTNEIVECDGCGVSVHEGCYGVSDSTSVSSTTSSCSTEPWFCEACKAGVIDPSCELCPNIGGIFKETDVGKWVHLVCALYVPGVAFGEVDQLSSVTLFEMPYSRWGAKSCSLCEDAKFARTGVCIGCDAGMCKTYFHVTCAQAAGFLSEPHSDEADHADPFYAHCKVHSDKTMIKHRKRNFNTLRLRMEQRKFAKIENQCEKPTSEQLRIQRKLSKHQTKYKTTKLLKIEPWVPTQKMPRLLTTSATACKKLHLKAELMGIDTAAQEFQETQMAALADVKKKWHIPPAFSVEFVGYYFDRISRSKDLKCSLERHISDNKKLLDEQQSVRLEYDQQVKLNIDETSRNSSIKDKIELLHKQIQALCPTKTLPDVAHIGRTVVIPTVQTTAPSARPMSVPTAAALKMGVGFPLTNLPGTRDDTGRILSTQRQSKDDLVHECGICKRCNDQHMLAKCDTCHFYYHLGCLNPPLTRHPKKSKLYGWQCSECDKSDDSDAIVDLVKGPRKSRTRFSKDGSIVPVDANMSAASSDGNLSIKITSEKNSIKKDKKSKEDNVASPPPCEPPPPPPPPPPPEENSKPEEETNGTEIESKQEKQKLNKKLKKEKEKKLQSEEINKDVTNSIPENNETNTSNVDNVVSDMNKEQENAIEAVDQMHKQNRKRRKEKHKNKYASDNEKSPSKEHKRKRKKKSHDSENPNDSVPKIKIKFKTLPLPGEAAPEPQFFYVSADMLRPQDTSRSTSVETVDDSTTNVPTVNSTKPPPPARISSPRKSNKRDSLMLNTPTVESRGSTNIVCDVCNQEGNNQNVVKCDECEKNFHFTCLDPPLKKTPKKKGYSWHCADCDTTDVEST